MIKTRKTKELSEILAPLCLNSFTFMQMANALLPRTVWGVILQDVSGDFSKVHYFCSLSKLPGCEEERQRATQGVREVVETASDKMSAAPELNPGDWKWIECISPYIDSRWHRRDSDMERERGEVGVSQRVGRGWRKGAAGREKKSSGVLPADHWSFSNPPSSPIIPLLRPRVLFSPSHTALWCSAKPAGCPAERPISWPRHQHQEMDTIGRARLIPGWQEQEGIGFLGVKMP